MKLFCYFVFIFMLTACDGEAFDNTIAAEHSEELYLNGHAVNDVLRLKSGSLWLIVGLSSSAGAISEGVKDVIIYDNPNDFGEPDQGVKGQYFVFINESSDSFYINPIANPSILKEGDVSLGLLSLGSIAVLGDNSVWTVKGIDSPDFIDSIPFDYTLYDVKDNFPDLISDPSGASGELSDWYLFNEDAPFGYYLEPEISAKIIWEGTHNFYGEGVQDSLLLSDGSLWLITGILLSETSPNDEYTIKLIQNVDIAAEPIKGEKSTTILYIQGYESAFYVSKI